MGDRAIGEKGGNQGSERERGREIRIGIGL
jgi:hypothetical protein